MPNPPKPIELKRRLGNPGRRPLPAQTETVALPPALKIPRAPKSLSPAAKRMFREIWKTAHEWLTPALDAPTVIQVCRIYEQIEAFQESIDKYGTVVEEPIVSPKGEVVGYALKPNPAYKMMRQAEVNLRSLLSELGFTPTARARLGLAEVRTQSKLEELFARREKRARQVERGEDRYRDAIDTRASG